MKQVTIVIPKGRVTLSSVTGAFEILRSADAQWQREGHRPRMQICLAGFESELRLDTGYFTIHPTPIEDIKKTDLVLIPATAPDDALVRDNADLIEWIKGQYINGAEIATMCSGVFLLAATGLLDGKSCSTHWHHANNFKNLYPKVNLRSEELITATNGIYTNGGAYSFLHLILFLVEKYWDRETSIYCSKIFQIDMDRHSQSPFFIFKAQKNHGDDLISKTQNYLEENVAEKLSFEVIASRLAISRRNLDRRFIKATGNTPMEYLQRMRVEIAKKSLEKGRKTILEIMDEVGYADDKAFREVFKRLVGVSPLEYRSRFNREAALQ